VRCAGVRKWFEFSVVFRESCDDGDGGVSSLFGFTLYKG
jgi:hypothetical protein